MRTMRCYLFGFLCICILGVLPLVWCGETSGDGGSGGIGGAGGTSGTGGLLGCGDENDSTGGDGGAAEITSRFPCTDQGVRDAIAAGGGPHGFECDGPTRIATRDEIVIDNDVTLDGEGDLTLDADHKHRVFSVPEGVTAELRRLAVSRGGDARTFGGGGIRNEGTLTLTNTTVSGSTSTLGGGIWNGGVMTMTNAAVSGSSADEGGGIHIVQTGTATITNTAISGSDARLGGGIFNDGTLTATCMIVSENSAEMGAGIVNERRLSLTSTRISGNVAREDGGGIWSEPGPAGSGRSGTVTLLNSAVSGNIAGRNGGGIDSGGTLTLTDSSVSGNTAGSSGGGIDLRGPTATLTSSTVAGNTAARDGGGIHNEDPARTTLTNTTVSWNTASSLGGGVFNGGWLALTNATIWGNTAVSGGGISNLGRVQIANSIIDGGCSAPLISLGFNVQGMDDSCGFDESTDRAGVTAADLKLGPLADNGGPTKTHALEAGSLAVDIVTAAACVDHEGEPVETDQRGVERPQAAACDAGAFELQP